MENAKIEVGKDLLVKLESLNRVVEIFEMLENGLFAGKYGKNLDKCMDFLNDLQTAIITEAKAHPDAHLVKGLLEAGEQPKQLN